jgi:hypothetical protein
MKTCTKCNKEYDLTKFPKDNRRVDGRGSCCKKCQQDLINVSRRKKPELYRKHQEKFRKENPSKYIENQYKSVRGITREEMLEMLEAQGNVCKICGTSEPGNKGWMVDHDHTCCGKVRRCKKCIRGILCRGCNSMLGFARDNVKTLTIAINYLLQHESKVTNAIVQSDDVRGTE